MVYLADVEIKKKKKKCFNSTHKMCMHTYIIFILDILDKKTNILG